MNEEPKSIWKESRRTWFRAWWISLAAVFVVVITASGFTGHLVVPDWPRILVFYLIVSAIIAAFLAGLWVSVSKSMEKPESIWRKSWTGWGRLWTWLILVMATFFIVLIISLITPSGSRNFPDWRFALGVTLIVSVVAAMVGGLVGFICWLVHWRNFKRFLFCLACFATLIALFYAEEDWRGWHAWNQFKHEWEAKGEKLDWQSIVPPPVPDDNNFAFSPVWIAEIKSNLLYNPKRAEAWYGQRIYSEEVSKLIPLVPVSVSGLVGAKWGNRSAPTPVTSGDWATAYLTDLKPWQAYYRGFETTNPTAEIPISPQLQSPAVNVLLALSKFDPVIEQLRQDSARPYSRFPLGYDDEDKASILLPDLAAVKRYAQVLQLRAIAELQNSQTDKALADVKLSLRLVDTIRTEPFLISHLVRIAVLEECALQPIYEGLAEHKWSDAQLIELDSELGKLDFLADYKLAMHGELGFQDGIVNYLRQHPKQYVNLMSYSDNDSKSAADFIVTAAMVFHLVPSGWFYQNQLRCARAMEEEYLPAADVRQQTFMPALFRQADAMVARERKNLTPYNVLEKPYVSLFEQCGRKIRLRAIIGGFGTNGYRIGAFPARARGVSRIARRARAAVH